MSLEFSRVTNTNSVNEAEVLQKMIAGLSPLDDEARLRLLDTVARFFDLPSGGSRPRSTALQAQRGTESSADDDGEDTALDSLSPKTFLMEKNPHTLVDRVVCLAYYLTVHRDQRYFKTFDISKLNSEAAQGKFSNSAQSVADSTKAGFLVVASHGNKQLSALGEQYAKALPDKEEARAVVKRMKPRRSRRKKSKGMKDAK